VTHQSYVTTSWTSVISVRCILYQHVAHSLPCCPRWSRYRPPRHGRHEPGNLAISLIPVPDDGHLSAESSKLQAHCIGSPGTRAGRPSSWRQNSITPAHDGRRESQRTLGEAVRSRKVSGRYRRMPERSIWPVPRDALPKPAAEQIGGYGSSSPLRSLPRSVMARLTTLKVAGGAERRSGRRLTVFARRGRSSFCPLFAVTASREGGGGCRVIV
jgi:hypothetical protein